MTASFPLPSGPLKNRKPATAMGEGVQGSFAGLLFWKADVGWQLRDAYGQEALTVSALACLEPELDHRRRYFAALECLPDGRWQCCWLQALQPEGFQIELQAKADGLRTRWQIHQAVRRFFLERQFQEVDTPLRVIRPGMEPYLDTFPVGGGFLRTSPELHMKQLLAAGEDRLFQMGPCFRAGDRGRLHREEFLMLEWYRAFAGLTDLADDLTDLLGALAAYARDPDFFAAKPQVATCSELFERYLGLRLNAQSDESVLRQCADRHGIHHQDDDDWDVLYFRLFLSKIEPHLGRDRPQLVHAYPATQSALAKQERVAPGDLPVCRRLELYIHGVELANGYDELTDLEEHRRRMDQENAVRRQMGKVTYADDPDFMAAVSSGMPPAAGIALGLDRLVMVLLGFKSLDDVLPFPDFQTPSDASDKKG